MTELDRPYDHEIDGFADPPYDQARDVPESPGGPTARRVLGSMALAGMAVLGIGIGLKGVEEAVNESRASCPAPSAKSIAKVTGLFAAEPKTWYYYEDLPAPSANLPSSSEAQQALYYSGISPGVSFSRQLRVANTYTRPYGVTISVASDQEAAEYEVKRPSTEFLANEATRYNLSRVVRGVMHLPVEYIRLSDVKRVVLYYDTERHAKGGGAVGGFAPGRGGKTAEDVYYNLAGSNTESVIYHEVYHQVDRRVCGDSGMDKDPGFTGLNPENIYEKRGDYESMENGLLSYSFPLSEDGDCESVDRRRRIFARTVTASEYGFTDPSEDKAEIGMAIGAPQDFGKYLEPGSPVLRNKFIFLMARLYQSVPNVVRDLAASSSRPAKPEPTAEC